MKAPLPLCGLATALVLVSTVMNRAAAPPAGLSQVAITPASAGMPSSFTGMVIGGPPNGTARLQASVDLGKADPWTDIATAVLDNLGSATFTNIPDLRPQAATASGNFFRVSTSAPPLVTMVLITGGTFQMGDTFNEGWELPVHSVYVSSFHLQNTEVTKAQWDAVREWGAAAGRGYTDLSVGSYNNGKNYSKGPNHPVLFITWYDMVKWCNARSQMEGMEACYTVSGAIYKTGGRDDVVCNWNANGYRLPTEAEWEWAARGGESGKRFPWGDIINHSNANYWNTNYSYESPQNQGYHPIYNDGVLPYTSPVGTFPANSYGLYDMAGNLCEWCWDWHDAYPSASQSDPRGPSSGSDRVYRGGAWDFPAAGCRSAYRYFDPPGYRSPSFGFRPARSSVL